MFQSFFFHPSFRQLKSFSFVVSRREFSIASPTTSTASNETKNLEKKSEIKNRKKTSRFSISIDQQRAHFDRVGSALGIHRLEDWYSITRRRFVQADRSISPSIRMTTLIQKVYGDSLIRALKTIYSQHDWIDWKFKHSGVPQGFWTEAQNRRKYMEWIATTQLGVSKLDDWFRVSGKQFARAIIKSGTTRGPVHSYYKDSLIRALRDVYPNHDWPDWKFHESVSHGFWSKIENQRQFMDWLASKSNLNLSNLDGWYSVDRKKVFELGGGGMLANLYDNSLIRALKAIYPEHGWIDWNFARTPHLFWHDRDNRKKYFMWVAKTKGKKDVRELRLEDVEQNRSGKSMMAKFYKRSIEKAFEDLFDEKIEEKKKDSR